MKHSKQHPDLGTADAHTPGFETAAVRSAELTRLLRTASEMRRLEWNMLRKEAVTGSRAREVWPDPDEAA